MYLWEESAIDGIDFRPNWWQRLIARMASSGPGAWLLSRVMHRLDRGLMRLSGVRLMLPGLVVGVPTILITTTGARSGQPRTLPLVAVPDGERLILIASNWGGQRNPGWYYNLKANPACEGAVEGESKQYVARGGRGRAGVGVEAGGGGLSRLQGVPAAGCAAYDSGDGVRAGVAGVSKAGGELWPDENLACQGRGR